MLIRIDGESIGGGIAEGFEVGETSSGPIIKFDGESEIIKSDGVKMTLEAESLGELEDMSALGTSEIDSCPVNSLPSFRAECGSTSRVIPSVGFVTIVVAFGSIVVMLSVAIRGR